MNFTLYIVHDPHPTLKNYSHRRKNTLNGGTSKENYDNKLDVKLFLKDQKKIMSINSHLYVGDVIMIPER